MMVEKRTNHRNQMEDLKKKVISWGEKKEYMII